jgi:hypothetical protein
LGGEELVAVCLGRFFFREGIEQVEARPVIVLEAGGGKGEVTGGLVVEWLVTGLR